MHPLMRSTTSSSHSGDSSMSRSFLCSLVAFVASFQTASAAVPTTGVPAYDAAATKAVAFLKQEIGKADKEAGHGSFMAYALLKGGEPASLPGIQKAIADVRSRITTTGYKPSNPSHHIYEAGVDILIQRFTTPTSKQLPPILLLNRARTARGTIPVEQWVTRVWLNMPRLDSGQPARQGSMCLWKSGTKWPHGTFARSMGMVGSSITPVKMSAPQQAAQKRR